MQLNFFRGFLVSNSSRTAWLPCPHRFTVIARSLGRCGAGILLTVSLTCEFGGARADFEDGWAAYVAGNYTVAYREWLSVAELGHGGAQLNLGFLHERGLGVAQDAAKAMDWFKRAADNGESAALHNIGVLYRDGNGVRQDLAEAAKWFLASAEGGDSYGRFRLGLAMIEGHGVAQNVEDGIELIRKAADDGNPLAAFELGAMRRHGRHLEQSSVEAASWYRIAADSGSGDAAGELGTMYAEGDGVEVDRIRAYAWFWVANRRGHALANIASHLLAQSMSEAEIAAARELGDGFLRSPPGQNVQLTLSAR